MAKSETPTSAPFRTYGRSSFLRLDRPKKFDDNGEPRWEGTQLLDPANPKGLEGIKLTLKMMAEVSKQAYGVVPLEVKRLAARFCGGPAVAPTEKDDGIEVACYDGSSKDYDGYDGMFVIPGHNSKLKPAVANRKGQPVQPGEDQWPYSGCNSIHSWTAWAQTGQTQKRYGKRIGINLRGVQFHSDNEAFGAGDIAAEEEFQALEDDAAAAASTTGNPWD